MSERVHGRESGGSSCGSRLSDYISWPAERRHLNEQPGGRRAARRLTHTLGGVAATGGPARAHVGMISVEATRGGGGGGANNARTWRRRATWLSGRGADPSSEELQEDE